MYCTTLTVYLFLNNHYKFHQKNYTKFDERRCAYRLTQKHFSFQISKTLLKASENLVSILSVSAFFFICKVCVLQCV